MSDTVIWVLVVVIVVLLCVAAGLVVRQRRTAQLRQGFGPEYDRVVKERGDRAGEAELQERRERRRKYDIRPLRESARERYGERWQETQRRFVDQPASAVADADGLVSQVMSDRGYPVEDFGQQAADVSVDHPGVVEHYRAAHAISVASAQQSASTEDLRQAMVHYRALFSELLSDGADADDPRQVEDVKETN